MQRTGGGALRLLVVEATGWSEFGNNGGARRFQQVYAWGGQKKKKGTLVIKQGQRCDVRAQSHDVPEGGASNVMTFTPNVAK